MKIILSFLVAVMGYLLAVAMLNNRITDQVRLLRPAEPIDDGGRKVFGKNQRIIISAVFGMASGVGAYCVLIATDDIIHILKLLIGIFCLIGSGCVDLKEHRIPNFFPLVLSVCSIVLLAVGFFAGQEGALSYIVAAVISTTAVVLLMLAASLLTRGGIGAGDIKLLGAIALIGDIYLLSSTVLFGVLSCAIAGVVLMIVRKKTIKEGLPFGPFLLSGYLLSLYIQMF